MLLELILVAAIGQNKQPPPAPVQPSPAILVIDKGQLEEQNKRIAALEATVLELKTTPCPHCKKLSTDPVVIRKKFFMTDKNGKGWQNDSYERLLYDVNLINNPPSEQPPITIQYSVQPRMMSGSSCGINSRGQMQCGN